MSNERYVPERVGPYRIQRPLGSGAMGSVYLAFDGRSGEVVALKLLHPHLQADARAREAFVLEARVGSLFRSPYVVHIADYGETNGLTYLVMEFVNGGTLAASLRGGAMDPAKAIHVGWAIAAALEEADKHQVVHHDIKPDNILLGDDGAVKVADFGIASQVDFVPGTLDGRRGRLEYMAPERLAGAPSDRRSDIYGLGAVMFHMLTGRAPFMGSAFEIMRQQHEGRLSVADLPAELRTFVAKCLSTNPGDRFQEAREVVFALETASVSLGVGLPNTANASPPTASTDGISSHEVGRRRPIDRAHWGEPATRWTTLWRVASILVVALAAVGVVELGRFLAAPSIGVTGASVESVSATFAGQDSVVEVASVATVQGKDGVLVTTESPASDEGKATGTPRDLGASSVGGSVSTSGTGMSGGDGGGSGDPKGGDLHPDQRIRPPNSPSNLLARARSSTSIELSWADNSDNETMFTVHGGLSPGGVLTLPAGTTVAELGGLLPATAYCARVSASSSAGTSGQSNEACATTLLPLPEAPSGLTASAASSTSITLNWSDNSGNEVGFTVYGASLPDGKVTVGAGSAILTLRGLEPGTSYCSTVTAFNSAGESRPSNEACATTQRLAPRAPSNLTATPSVTAITLSWSDNSDNESGFNLYSPPLQNGKVTVGAGTTSYALSGLQPSTQYCAQVSAFNPDGESSRTAQICATTANLPQLTAPSGVTATALSTSQIRVTWVDTSQDETGFRVFDGETFATLAANGTTYVASGLPASKYKCYQVQSVRGAETSPWTAYACTSTLAPTAKSADLNGDGIVNDVDVNLLKADYGKCGSPPSDLNNDGCTNITDLSILLSRYGTAG